MKKGIILILSLVVISASYFAIELAPPPLAETFIDPNAPENSNIENTEPIKNEFTGEATVTGFAQITEVNDPRCTENCSPEKYVLFNITTTPDTKLTKFIQSHEKSSYIGGSRIGLGCITTNESILYENISNQLGAKEFTISAEIAQKIINSHQTAPITLNLKRLAPPPNVLSSNSVCSSNFTEIALVE